jgi:hypothetical protein
MELTGRKHPKLMPGVVKGHVTCYRGRTLVSAGRDNEPSDEEAHLELLMTTDQAVAGWRALQRQHRWTWFQKLYQQAAHLDRRYRLALRSGWWDDDVQIESLAALGAWIGMFDYANWADPEAKTRLIFQLPAVRELLRGGAQQFDPERDRDAFEHHLRNARGCEDPAMLREQDHHEEEERSRRLKPEAAIRNDDQHLRHDGDLADQGNARDR